MIVTFSFGFCVWAANALRECLFLQEPLLTLKVRGKKIIRNGFQWGLV